MRKDPEKRRYVIRLGLGATSELARLRERLRGSGVEIDEQFGFVPLDLEGSSVVTRGIADAEARRRANEELGAEFFPDLPIGPVTDGTG